MTHNKNPLAYKEIMRPPTKSLKYRSMKFLITVGIFIAISYTIQPYMKQAYASVSNKITSISMSISGYDFSLKAIMESIDKYRHPTKYELPRLPREELNILLDKWAMHFKVDPAVVHAIVQIESNHETDRLRWEKDYYTNYVAGNKWKKMGFPSYWKLKDQGQKMQVSMSYGAGQLMPLTAHNTAKRLGIKVNHYHDLKDPDLNAQLTVGLIRHCIDSRPNSFLHLAKCYNGVQTNNLEKKFLNCERADMNNYKNFKSCYNKIQAEDWRAKVSKELINSLLVEGEKE